MIELPLRKVIQMRFQAVLLDLDGTLYQGEEAIPGSVEAVGRLRTAGLGLRFTTNTTRRPVRALAGKLTGLGFEVSAEEVLTAPRAATRWLLGQGLKRIHPLLAEETLEDLAGLEIVDHDADAVLVGDLGANWSRPRLDRAMQLLLEGARLIAVQKNRYGRGPGGLELDAGAFVAALEYAASVESVVVGKPNPAFFRAAVDDLGLQPEQVIAVGDDLRTDVAGGLAAGVSAVLVRTGKYRPSDESDPETTPDAVLDSIADLPEYLRG
jgi:HAD superfamily hydrolase (TIGR01458 family)